MPARFTTTSQHARRTRPAAVGACVAALGLLAGSAFAGAAHFVIDPVHSRIAFRVSHLGLSQSIGTFSGITGTLDFDPADWRGAKLAADIPLQRLDLGDAHWQRKALSAQFLDVATQPVAHFLATGVEVIDTTHARVSGTLRLRGRSTPVVLEATMNGARRSLYTLFHKTVGFSAHTTLHRRELGMDAYPDDVIGADVAVDIELEAEAHADHPTQPAAKADAATTSPPAPVPEPQP